MKVFIDANILIDISARADQYPASVKTINDLIERKGCSLWLSAVSINNVEYILFKLIGKERTRKFLEFIYDHFVIIPFRKSIFIKAMARNASDFEDAIQMSSAEQFHVDWVVTRNGDHFRDCRVPVVSPDEFLDIWNKGQADAVSTVPFLDLKAQHCRIYNEIDDRMTDIIANTGFILGKHVDEFERGFAEIQGSRYALGVSSGTAALHMALSALGIGAGDEVVFPVNTFIATAEAVSMAGATPVFIDCDANYNMDTEKLESLLRHKARADESRVKAVIPVHLYGQPADMSRIMNLADEFNLSVIEDACQAHLARYNGKRVGNFGSFGAFSFYPGKNLGAYGEAGALVTNDADLYRRAKLFRQHGEIERYQHQVPGYNYRMEAFQGAVLSTKLKYIKEWTAGRRKNARLYSQRLKEVPGVRVPKELTGTECVYHLYVIEVEDRQGLQQYFGENGILSVLHYPMPLHLQEAYRHLGYKEGDFPSAEQAAKRILSLPMYPELSERQIEFVCRKVILQKAPAPYLVSRERKGKAQNHSKSLYLFGR